MTTTRPAQVTLHTQRFALRPVRLSDVTRIEHYAADKRLAEQTPRIPHPLPPGMIATSIERALHPERDEDIWIMDGGGTDGDEVMGVIRLQRLDRNQSDKVLTNAGFAYLGDAETFCLARGATVPTWTYSLKLR